MWQCQEVTCVASLDPAKHLLQTARAPSPACKANTCLTQPGFAVLPAPLCEARSRCSGNKLPSPALGECWSKETAVCRTGKVPAASLGPLAMPALPQLDMAPALSLRPSPLGTTLETGPWPGAPSVVAGVGRHAVMLWGN